MPKQISYPWDILNEDLLHVHLAKQFGNKMEVYGEPLEIVWEKDSMMLEIVGICHEVLYWEDDVEKDQNRIPS